jgi:hypothetical protein
MHGPINVKSPNNISELQMGFNSAFKGLRQETAEIRSKTGWRLGRRDRPFASIPSSNTFRRIKQNPFGKMASRFIPERNERTEWQRMQPDGRGALPQIVFPPRSACFNIPSQKTTETGPRLNVTSSQSFASGFPPHHVTTKIGIIWRIA